MADCARLSIRSPSPAARTPASARGKRLGGLPSRRRRLRPPPGRRAGRPRAGGRLNATYRATDGDVQVLYDNSPDALGQHTLAAGGSQTVWDVVRLSDDRQHEPAYVGYMVAGQLVEPQREAELTWTG